MGADSADATLTYSLNGLAGPWVPVVQQTGFEISLTGMTTSPTGTTHTVQWNCTAALNDAGQPFGTCYVRINATDNDGSTGDVDSNAFYLGNTPPVADVADISGTQSGNLPITFYLQDNESDACDVTIQYSTKRLARPSGSSVTSHRLW